MDPITEYDEEEHMRLIRRDEREEGIRIFIEDKVEDGIPDEQIREKLRNKYHLHDDQIDECMKKYANTMLVS